MSPSHPYLKLARSAFEAGLDLFRAEGIWRADPLQNQLGLLGRLPYLDRKIRFPSCSTLSVSRHCPGALPRTAICGTPAWRSARTEPRPRRSIDGPNRAGRPTPATRSTA